MISMFSFLSFISKAQLLRSPENLQAEFDNEERIVRLTWVPGDSTVAGYNLFVKTGSQDEYYLWGRAGLIYQPAYDYKVLSHVGERYEFKVSAVQNFPVVIRSEFSNTVTVDVPSQHLTMVNINNPKVKKHTAAISWTYSTTAADFQGFILYLDGGELKVKKEAREYVIDDMASGKHIVQIVAYTTSGIRSKMSSKKFILIK